MQFVRRAITQVDQLPNVRTRQSAKLAVDQRECFERGVRDGPAHFFGCGRRRAVQNVGSVKMIAALLRQEPDDRRLGLERQRTETWRRACQYTRLIGCHGVGGGLASFRLKFDASAQR